MTCPRVSACKWLWGSGIFFLVLSLVACTIPVTTLPPTITPLPPPTVTPEVGIFHSTPQFQVFILNPVHTCIAADDFYSGDVCHGTDCGDCNCTWEEFDPPAPLSGIKPSQINDPQYAGFEYRECFDITLTDVEVQSVIDDMNLSRDLIYAWTDGALDLQMEYTVLPHDHTGFVAPDFVFGPFEVDDELLNSYVTTNTDLVYVVTGVRDHQKDVDLAYWCGSSYGELSIHGASYSYIQLNAAACNPVHLEGRQIYEPLIHEVYHNVDWALYNLSGSPDLYQFASPDWGNWKQNDWPACKAGASDPLQWFPSIDFCEWDPDWLDCNNVASAGRCIHAGDGGGISWYEHVMSVHYPRTVEFIGNFCRDGKQDFGETGVDTGGPCL